MKPLSRVYWLMSPGIEPYVGIQYRRGARIWLIEHGAIWVYGWCNETSFRVINDDNKVIVE
jgi:hypothetical protein